MASREQDLEFDLESGWTNSEEEETSNELESTKREAKSNQIWFWSRLFNVDESRSHKSHNPSSTCSNSSKYNTHITLDENVELLIERNSEEESRELIAVLEKKNMKEKYKKNRKAHKPPRPPKGPSLDAADMMLVKEIAEIAIKRRTRVERIKALKKMKAEKTSTCNSSLPALLITVFFFVVIIFQGISSRSGAMFQGSPEPAEGESGEGIISIQFSQNLFPSESNGPRPSTLNFAGAQSSVSIPVQEAQ